MSKTMVLKVIKRTDDKKNKTKKKKNFSESYHSVLNKMKGQNTWTSGFHVIENIIKSRSIVYKPVNH